MTRVILDLDVRVPMRDGVLLNAEVWRPDTAAPVPAVLIRSPYPDPVARAALDPVRAARLGFAVVVQQARGTGQSEGDFEPWLAEAADGADTIAWCARQPWCSGDVGTLGLSYLAHSQLYAAGERPGALRAMVLEVVPLDPYSLTYVGGTLALGSSLGWSIAQTANALMRRRGRGEQLGADLDLLADTVRDNAHLARRSLRDVRPLQRNFPSWERWLDHPTRDAWWRERACPVDARLPALCVGGWFDIFLRGTLEAWKVVSGHPRSGLMIGPWAHNGRSSALGGLNFGAEAAAAQVDLMGRELGFLAANLRVAAAEPSSTADPPAGVGPSVDANGEATIRVFVMGQNRWRELAAWPPPEAATHDFYLRSDGGLSRQRPPVGAAPRTFTFDPADPVPTVGGPNLFSDSEAAYQAGPWDQSILDGRTDILRFVSEPLDQPLLVIGEVSVRLWASTSAADTDWTAKLVDVRPDGRAFNLLDGIVRARHRLGFDRVDLPTPGEVYEYTIDLVATAYRFSTGSRVRVDISSSNYPRFDINPGDGALMADSSATVLAEQTVLLDADHPSRLILPAVA